MLVITKPELDMYDEISLHSERALSVFQLKGTKRNIISKHGHIILK